MRTLQILPELNIGGVERGTVDLARQLIRRNHEAIVISNGGGLVKELESCGARHIRLPVHRKSLFSILTNIPKVVRILREEKVDIVHARSRVPALIAFLAARVTGTNFVTTCHGYYSRNFFSRVMGWGKLIIVASDVVARHMIEDFGVPQERIRLIPRGVDLGKFKFRQLSDVNSRMSDVFTIGVIGRLTPIKGHKYFLWALAKVIRVIPRVSALIVGEVSPGKDGYKEELKMLTRRLSLDRCVEFLGYQNNIPRILCRLDVLVMPSVTQEAFGRVLIEAQAAGVAVIATRVGGVVDIIQDGVNGILVEPQDPGDLASALLRLFKEPEFAQKLTRAGRKNVEENFSLEQMAEKTIRVYEETQATLKILVIKLSAPGDVILAVPSLRALRANFPAAHIAVMTQRSNRSILQNCPYINQIIEFPLEKGYKGIWRLSSVLRRLNFDIIVDLQNNRRSHALSFLSGCNRRYGYNNGKFGFLLNRKVKETGSPLSPIEHQGRTLRLLDIKSVRGDLELWPKEDDENWAEGFLKAHRKNEPAPLIGINIGASSAWPSKRWGIEKFAALLDKTQAGLPTRQGIRAEIIITGKGAADKELRRGLSRLCKSSFIDAVDKTSIMQLASLIKRCNIYITSDSAPLHIACAMKIPVVALFGPTDPRRHIVPGARQVVIKKKLSCSGCYKRRCRKHTCMKEIGVEEVFEAVERFLR